MSLWDVRSHLESTRHDISKDYRISTYNAVRILNMKSESHFVAGWVLREMNCAKYRNAEASSAHSPRVVSR
jgi:hypothetical protein